MWENMKAEYMQAHGLRDGPQAAAEAPQPEAVPWTVATRSVRTSEAARQVAKIKEAAAEAAARRAYEDEQP